jgi:hypothetical protein
MYGLLDDLFSRLFFLKEEELFSAIVFGMLDSELWKLLS